MGSFSYVPFPVSNANAFSLSTQNKSRLVTICMALDFFISFAVFVCWLSGFAQDLAELLCILPPDAHHCPKEIIEGLALVKWICSTMYSSMALSAALAVFGYLLNWNISFVHQYTVLAVIRMVFTVLMGIHLCVLMYNENVVFAGTMIATAVSILLNFLHLVCGPQQDEGDASANVNVDDDVELGL